MWRDVFTPTFASKADAMVKVVQASVYPVSYAPEALRLSEAEQDRIRLRSQEDSADVDRLMARAAPGDEPPAIPAAAPAEQPADAMR